MFISCVIAITYFAFRIEISEGEYLLNHHNMPDGISMANPTVNWETFDKDNAYPGFIFDALLNGILVAAYPYELQEDSYRYTEIHLVRDKSPPIKARQHII